MTGTAQPRSMRLARPDREGEEEINLASVPGNVDCCDAEAECCTGS